MMTERFVCDINLWAVWIFIKKFYSVIKLKNVLFQVICHMAIKLIVETVKSWDKSGHLLIFFNYITLEISLAAKNKPCVCIARM